jgi:hypothetical protein
VPREKTIGKAIGTKAGGSPPAPKKPVSKLD